MRHGDQQLLPAAQSSTQGGAPAAGQAGAGAAASGEKVHIVYFNARGAEVAERDLVERYMQDHPNVDIEYLSTTSLGGPSDTDAIANLIFNIQAKKVIDVAKIEVSRTPLDLMASNSIQDLGRGWQRRAAKPAQGPAQQQLRQHQQRRLGHALRI